MDINHNFVGNGCGWTLDMDDVLFFYRGIRMDITLPIPLIILTQTLFMSHVCVVSRLTLASESRLAGSAGSATSTVRVSTTMTPAGRPPSRPRPPHHRLRPAAHHLRERAGVQETRLPLGRVRCQRAGRGHSVRDIRHTTRKADAYRVAAWLGVA